MAQIGQGVPKISLFSFMLDDNDDDDNEENKTRINYSIFRPIGQGENNRTLAKRILL